MKRDYLNVYIPANKFAMSSMSPKPFPATHYLQEFFTNSKNLVDSKGEPMPSVARMLLQQAYVDSLDILKDDYDEGIISINQFENKKQNMANAIYNAQICPEMEELNKQILKTNKKTGLKRLAIIPAILDSNEYGLSAVRHSNKLVKTDSFIYSLACYIVQKMNPAVEILDEELVENKGIKKIQYAFRRLSSIFAR